MNRIKKSLNLKFHCDKTLNDLQDFLKFFKSSQEIKTFSIDQGNYYIHVACNKCEIPYLDLLFSNTQVFYTVKKTSLPLPIRHENYLLFSWLDTSR